MKRNAMLAVDMGASNGRVVWGQWHESGLECREIHRFDNVPIQRNGLMCWDMPRLMDEIAQGIAKCDRAFDTLGLCSWGNTIGLLDEERSLIRAPIHYREPKTDEGLPALYAALSREEMFRQTLYIPMTIQPAVVLSYLKQAQPDVLKKTKSVLMISDLMNELMTGKAVSERTMAATSGMVDMRTGAWSRTYMEKAGVDPAWFPDLVSSQTILGPLKDAFYNKEGKKPLVVAVAGHDTASASGLVDMSRKEDSLYLSCGTWSCMGCGVEKPSEDERILALGATNDLGPDGENQLRFNHTGLWILQECRREWIRQGHAFTHAELAQMACNCGSVNAVIDTEDELFFRSERMPQKVMQYLEMTGQPVVKEPGEIVRVILESLALRYRYSVDVLSELTSIRFSSMRVFGGGSKNSLLCQLMADTTGLTVHAGPAEASTIGNFIQQGLAQGVFTDRKQALKLIETHETTTYQPAADCEEKYRRALEICKWKTL